jgi:hypothetical protein
MQVSILAAFVAGRSEQTPLGRGVTALPGRLCWLEFFARVI